jgi:hypothetical protein
VTRIIQRIETKQGHPVPKSAGPAKGPFPPELYVQPHVITEYAPEIEEIPAGGTAQNNFRPPKVFKCRDCDELVLEHEISNHIC